MRIRKYKKTLGIVLLLILCFSMSVSAEAAVRREVCVGGVPFGVRFHTDGVTVAEIEDVSTAGGEVCPAKDAGLLRGDVIVAVCGERVTSARRIIEYIENSDGGKLPITYRRGGSEYTVELVPVKDENGVYRAGMWIRDSAAGIGTVTYYDPDTGEFAGLGHGICNSETGELIPLSDGVVTEVSLCGIKKGAVGAPGELKGFFGARTIGTIRENTNTGVYGVLEKFPTMNGERVLIASKKDVSAGRVTVRCTLSDGETKDYEAEISEINLRRGECKNFIVTITDGELLEKTGGIVQGMSGSPILQNGRLIGAVTHVMINDPTRGYGIFIENMLNAAG